MPSLISLKSFIGNNKLLLCIILYNMISKCLAAPFDIDTYVDGHLSETEITALQVLKTILLAYVSHAATVRPDQSTRLLPTIYKRMSALAWPTSGIYEAVGSIRKKMASDDILGIGAPKIDISRNIDSTEEKETSNPEGQESGSEDDSSSVKTCSSEHQKLERNKRVLTYQDKSLEKIPEFSVDLEGKENLLTDSLSVMVLTSENPSTIGKTMSSESTITLNDKNMDKLRSQIGGVSLKAIYRSSISEVVSEHGEIDITEKEAMEARESAVSNSRETVFSVYKKVRIYQSTIDEFNRGKHDNGGYLRDLMISIGPVRAEKLKKAILSGSIYIGCNLVVEKEDYKPVHLKTEDMTIAGPGSKCSYQIPVHPKIVRYLSKPMLNQLREATCLEESAHLPRFISLIQLGYTLYEIIRGSGDSWSKIILGIFTIMSILQTASLFFLPMQVSAFSIESDLERDRAYYEKQGIQNIDIYNVNNFNGAMAHISEEVEGSEKKNARVALQVLARSRVPSYLGLALFVENKTRLKSLSTQPSGKWELCVLSSGVVVPLLFGIIAGYERHTTTQWLVIAWICSSIPFTFLRLFFLEPDLINSKTFIPMMLVMVLPGISLILAATICSYLP